MTKLFLLWMFITFIPVTCGESFNGLDITRTRHRSFEVPDVLRTPTLNGPHGVIRRRPISTAPDVVMATGTGTSAIADVPVLSEWDENYSDFSRRLVVVGARDRVGKSSFNDNSEVAAKLKEACRRCMISGDMECVALLCSVTSILSPVDSHKVEHKAFVTGASLHGDILCSLCKNARDVMCTIKFCEDPERDKNVAEESGVECSQGVCRWQKETVVSAGYNNYYNAWWQPNNLMLMFDQFTRDLSTAYQDFYTATSRAIDILGK